MSTTDNDAMSLSADIDAVDREVPIHDEFVELGSFGDDMLGEPHRTVFYNEENPQEWLRFESQLLVDLAEVE